MADSGNQAKWSDIVTLYTNLAAVRQKFGFSPPNVTPSSRQGGTINVSDITNLNSFITAMQSNSNLTNLAKPVTAPSAGALIYPLFVDTLATTISNMDNSNNFSNSSFGNSNFGNSSFGNSNFGNSSFGNSSFNASFHSSFNASFNSNFSNSGWFFGNADCWWL